MELQKFFTTDNLLLAVLLVLILLMPRLLRKLGPQALAVSGKGLKAKLDAGDDLLLLDVRTPEEFNGDLGHIAGAVNLPLAELPARLAQLGADLEGHKQTPVVVTCRTENRSGRAAQILKKAGFTQLAILSGGMIGWNKDNLPVVRN